MFHVLFLKDQIQLLGFGTFTQMLMILIVIQAI
nr:photosystem I P700 chlorophyll a apoprotein A1 [Chlamydomonas chlamydogama]UZA61931.1 photosystem I P700 chlorophyll a apoprotein A1 [Chlamydomonas chlamydogama]